MSSEFRDVRKGMYGHDGHARGESVATVDDMTFSIENAELCGGGGHFRRQQNHLLVCMLGGMDGRSSGTHHAGRTRRINAFVRAEELTYPPPR